MFSDHSGTRPDGAAPEGPVLESLQRAQEVGSALARATRRLEAAEASMSELVRLVPELICELGFNRALISRVEEGTWTPELLYDAGDPAWAAKLTELGTFTPQPLIAGRGETELVNEQHAILVLNVHLEPWRVHPGAPPLTKSPSYVAAPILSGGRVVGILHGERYDQPREVDETDLWMLVAFAQSVCLAFSRAALATELRAVHQRLTVASRSVDRSVADVHQLPDLRVTEDGPPGAAAFARHRPHSPTALPADVSARELEVLALVAAGKTNAAIARRLGVAESTVKQHVKNILRKLHVGTRSEAVARWFNVGNTPPI